MAKLDRKQFYAILQNDEKDFGWLVRKITLELKRGFQFIKDINKAVAIFGSGRFKEDNPHYQEARKLARLLAKEKFAVITGGGPGIMEAANKGAFEAKGKSIGLNIQLPKGQDYNPYVKKGIRFHYFFVRKFIFERSCHAYVYFPGGFGTLDEFFEIVNLIQNKKITRIPLVVAVGKDYWQPLFDFLKNEVCKKHNAITMQDLNIFYLADSAEEALEIIKKNVH